VIVGDAELVEAGLGLAVGEVLALGDVAGDVPAFGDEPGEAPGPASRAGTAAADPLGVALPVGDADADGVAAELAFAFGVVPGVDGGTDGDSRYCGSEHLNPRWLVHPWSARLPATWCMPPADTSTARPERSSASPLTADRPAGP
jgi:hypothetical protein